MEFSQEASESERREPINVLFVDDDPQLRSLLLDMLSINGFHGNACSDAYSALAMLKRQQFDVLITDLGMPGMSGLELAEVVHTDYPQMPIVLITGLKTEFNKNEASAKGIRAVLYKPFNLHEVKALIQKLAISNPSQK
jgi:CheY-like chemotaxis protein